MAQQPDVDPHRDVARETTSSRRADGGPQQHRSCQRALARRVRCAPRQPIDSNPECRQPPVARRPGRRPPHLEAPAVDPVARIREGQFDVRVRPDPATTRRSSPQGTQRPRRTFRDRPPPRGRPAAAPSGSAAVLRRETGVLTSASQHPTVKYCCSEDHESQDSPTL